MVGLFRTKSFRAGMLGMALVFAVSLCACDDSSHKNDNVDIAPEKKRF